MDSPNSPPSLIRLHIAQTILACVGAADAGILWWSHRSNVELPCTADGACELVAQSKWAHITIGPLHDVPVALLGLISYIIALTLSMAKIASDDTRSVRLLNVPLILLSLGGTGYSWFLQYVSHYKIGALCPYCFTSACIMTLLFIAAGCEQAVLAGAVAAEPNPSASEKTHAKSQ